MTLTLEETKSEIINYSSMDEKETGLLPQAIWTEDNKTLTFYYGTDIVPGEVFNGFPVSNVWSGDDVVNSPKERTFYNAVSYSDKQKPVWLSTINKTVENVIFDESFLRVSPTSTMEWFSGCGKLTKIDFSGLNTSSVEIMGGMFSGCKSLTSLDLSGFDTSNVTRMDEVFRNCTGLLSINISSFDTSNVINMLGMFYHCNNLTYLDLSGFDTSNVTTMADMFSWCEGLTSLDFSGFDTSNVNSFTEMFYRCTNLSYLNIAGFNTSKAKYMDRMFLKCNSLTTTDVSGFDTTNVTDMDYMFSGCNSLATIDVSGFDTTNVTDMGYMFSDCNSLTTIDVSGFNTTNVTDLSYMFSGCNSLTTIDVSGFDTANVTEMDGMFSGCNSLTTIDVSGFDMSNVTKTQYMFNECSNVSMLDFSGSYCDIDPYGSCWDYMFRNCTNLKLLDFGTFSFHKIDGNYGVFRSSSAEGMFYNCSSLTSIYFDKDTVTWPNSLTGSNAFYGCASLVGKDSDATVLFDSNKTDISMAKTANLGGYFSVQKYINPESGTCGPNLTWTIEIGAGILTISGMGKMNDYEATGTRAPWSSYSINKVIIEEGVTGIGNNAFSGCSELTSIYFKGNAPSISSNAFTNVTATAYYPANDLTWTEGVRQNYGGNITWVEWDPGEPEVGNLFAPVVSKPISDGVFSFRSMLNNDNNISYTFSYDDAWLFNNNTSNRYKLLKTSIRIAMAAAGKGGEGDCGPDNIKDMMSSMGFKYTQSSVRYDVPQHDSIGTAIGLKNIKNSDGTESSIILVALRGGGYGIEWGGDFRVGSMSDIDHEGFRIAADEVETRLKDFVLQYREYINSDVKVWFTGFSRAAATSNLVASDLIHKKFIIDGISPGDVIAFCFECPKNTTNVYSDHSGEENIINIVNPIDFVPKVAFNNWGFSRYGKTYYIPSKETTSSYNENYKYQMIWKYQDLCEYNNSIGIEVTENEIVEVSGQASLLDDYFDYLSGSINRKKFNNEYEDVFIDIAAGCLGGGSVPDWGDAVPKMIKALGLPIALRPFTTGRVIGLFLKKNTGPGPAAHYPELCMSWIDSLDGFSQYFTEENSRYRMARVKCPVNVTVRNSSGEKVGQIINDEIEEIENGVVVRIDEDDHKVFVLPQDEEYTIEIQGREDGTVNYTVEEYDFDTNTTVKVINYKEIEISEGTEIVGTVSEAENIGETETTLHLKEDQETIEPDEVLIGDEVVSYSVEVSSAGNGNVFGGGSYVKGEFAKITAEADEGFEFSGWYEDDECVSTEYEYRFAVADNTSLTAVFIPEILISFEDESITLNTGKTAVLNVSISSPDVELDKCKWSSSDQNVANVDEKGTVTAQTPGMTVITVTTEDGKHSASCNVSVKGLIENADISGISDMTYTGEKLSHNLIIRDGDNSLEKDIDYYVEYSDNTNAGTATLTISGIGKYEGTVTKTFTINPASIANAALSGISSKIYTGKVQTQSPVVKIGDKTLVNETDYFLTYTNNTNAGTATITITGTGNYSGTKEETFTINKAAQSITVKSTATSIAVGKTATVSITGAKGTKSFKSSNTAIATVNSSTGVVTGKKAGTVTITATSAATSNYNAASKTVKITVTAGKSLKKPGNCHFAKWNNAKYTSCQIAWNKVAGADGYQTLLSWTNGTHASATIVQSNVLYRNCTVHPQHVSQMKVRAFYTEGGKRVFGPWSNIEYITPSPAKLTAKNAGSGSNVKVNISWNIIYGCNGYNVFITTNPNGKWYWNQSTSTNATATSAVITKYRGSGLKKNTRYYVRIVTRRKRNGVFCTVPMPANNTYIGSFVIK